MIVFASVIFGSKLTYLSSPFALCAIIPGPLFVFLIAILFGQLNAVFFSIMISLAVLNASSYQLVPFLFVLASSFASSRLVRKIDRSTDMVFVSVLQAVLNAVFIIIFKIIFNGSFANGLGAIVGVILNGFFSGILCLGLLTPLELLLNTASVFRLMDLSDNNTPIFKQMQIQANGTYNHSMMVAQLAEAACREIDANPLLARVGAYYHDIGKMDQSEYFVENQANMENKHNDLNPTLSASVIKSHVRKGVEKAHQLHLPQAVIDIIAEHHGNSIITYFFNAAKEKDSSLEEDDFRYPGIPPVTKESAVVMLADTVEAACHTLDNPTSQRLEKFITLLINQKVDHKQLDNCSLTFSDISKIKATFVNLLTGYYHNRIKYQNQQDPDEVKPNTEEAVIQTEAPKELPKTPVKESTKGPVKVTSAKTSAVKPAAPKTVKEKK